MKRNTKQNYIEYECSFLPESNSRLGIGYILQCNKEDSFGLVYGYRDHCRKRMVGGSWTWIYYFKKKKNLVMTQYSPVSFLKSLSRKIGNESYEISDILLLSNYTINDCKGIKRDYEKLGGDGYYHYNFEWNLIQNGEPFIAYDSYQLSVYYPTVNNLNKTISFHNYTVFKWDEGENIVSCFIGIRHLSFYSTEPKMEYVTSTLKKINKYVTNFNISLSTKTFIAGQSGYFKSRPGKDDYFIITNYWRTTSKDSYIRQLVNLHEEKSSYNCLGQSEEEKDYDRIDVEETIKLRAAVKENYSRGEHYIFLIKEFFNEFQKRREMYLFYQNKINHFIEKANNELFKYNFIESSYFNFIETFNKNRR